MRVRNDGEPDTQPVAEQRGWVLADRYRMQARIGRGGMAEVFRAHDELLDRDVAVKVFKTIGDFDPDASTNGAVRRELELQSLAKLNHPNLITLFDGSVAGDGPAFLVLELVEGPDLATRLQDGPLTEADAREVGAQISDALGYVHAHGLVHRDVKPANILLGADRRARLSDFGIVRMIGSPQLTAANLTIGTAYYIAPEQARGSNVGPAADVYSLGLVLLEALTGRRSFDGPMHEALAARVTTRPAVPPGLPHPWPELLTAMTELDPAARPEAPAVARALRSGTTTAATAALGPALALPGAEPTVAALSAPAAFPGSSTRPTYAPPDEPRRRGVAGLVAGALLVLAALALGGFLLVQGTSGGGSGVDNPPAATTPTTSRTPSTSHSVAPVANENTGPATTGRTHSHSHGKQSKSHKQGPPPGHKKTTKPGKKDSTSAPSTPSSSSTSPTPSGSPSTSTPPPAP